MGPRHFFVSRRFRNLERRAGGFRGGVVTVRWDGPQRLRTESMLSAIRARTDAGRIVSLIGFIAGGIIGGLGFWALGYQALVVQPPTGRIVPNLLFLVSVLAFMFSLISPLALVLFIRRKRKSQMQRELGAIGGYAAAFAFVAGLGLLGVFVLEDLGIDSAVEGMVFLDAVFGFTFGGIAGSLLAERWMND